MWLCYALKSEHPILKKARENNIPTLKRGEALLKLLKTHKTVAVTGSHGKTTITFHFGKARNKLTLSDAQFGTEQVEGKY